jgi:predicted Zn-dependent peptidase
LTVLKDDIRRAINILGDAFSNTALDAAEFEVTK